jgi:predicted acyltransferase
MGSTAATLAPARPPSVRDDLAPATAPAKVERVLAIDALRGFDMFWIAGPEAGHWLLTSLIILVLGHLPEDVAWQMGHHWGGFTAWDLIMPLFLFIVGAAMPFSLGRRLEAGEGRAAIYARALRRVALLWVLGMISQGHLLLFRLDRLELYSNTLQAIAAGYLIATVVMVEVRQVRWQAAVGAGLLLAYWGAMALIAPPGGTAGDYGQGVNLAEWIDRSLLGSYRNHDPDYHYTWILSSLGFGATTLLGMFAGQVLRSPRPPRERLLLLLGGGVALLLLGWLWSFSLPCIKHLWTSSMVAWAGGWSVLALAAFYGVIDVVGWRRWCFPFVVIGANAIVAYMLQPLFDVHHLGEHLFGGFSRLFGAGAGFVLAVLSCTSLWLVLWLLYRRGIFLRV